jgi:hypothetical protein
MEAGRHTVARCSYDHAAEFANVDMRHFASESALLAGRSQDLDAPNTAFSTTPTLS